MLVIGFDHANEGVQLNALVLLRCRPVLSDLLSLVGMVANGLCRACISMGS